jgi:hypothetical protein
MNANFVEHFSTMRILFGSVLISCLIVANSNISKDDNDLIKKRKRGFRLPPDDFVYGLKHPKQNGITGIAAGKYPSDSRSISKRLSISTATL